MIYISFVGEQLLKARLGQGPAQDGRHVVAAGVVVVVADAVRVGKVGVLQPQLGGLGVHGGHPVRDGPAPKYSARALAPSLALAIMVAYSSASRGTCSPSSRAMWLESVPTRE